MVLNVSKSCDLKRLLTLILHQILAALHLKSFWLILSHLLVHLHLVAQLVACGFRMMSCNLTFHVNIWKKHLFQKSIAISAASNISSITFLKMMSDSNLEELGGGSTLTAFLSLVTRYCHLEPFSTTIYRVTKQAAFTGWRNRPKFDNF